MIKVCAHCKHVIEDLFYLDYGLSGNMLCESCSLVSELQAHTESYIQAKKDLERYEEDYLPILGRESEKYLSLQRTAIRAIDYYEEQIHLVKLKLSQIEE